MNSKDQLTLSLVAFYSSKGRAYLELTKPKLTVLVVFSSLMGYLMAVDVLSWFSFFVLALAGYLITGSANIGNQIIEKELDAKMQRTQNRPLPTGRVSSLEAAFLAGTLLLLGVFLLFEYLNPLSGWLGLFSWVLYVMLYTPLKQKTPLCVFVGAFPGAFPPMLGWIAATGTFSLAPGLLFLGQFAWQFPHFWAIAWKQYDQYHNAGFKMLPLAGGKNKRNATIVLLYTLFTIPAGMLLYHFGFAGKTYYIISLLSGIVFSLIAFNFYQTQTDKAALQLMFASFVYLPIIQITMVLDKV